ncbi:MAG: transposase [Glaciimonas sp.]|nr:transposase [Glaciimonas sp.]
MKTSKFSSLVFASALEKARQGRRVSDVCTELDISRATFFLWKKRFDVLPLAVIERIRELKKRATILENRVVELDLDRKLLQDTLKQLDVQTARKRILIDELQTYFDATRARTCTLLQMSRSLYSYQRLKKKYCTRKCHARRWSRWHPYKNARTMTNFG